MFHPHPQLSELVDIPIEENAIAIEAPTYVPINMQTVFLGGIFLFAILAACYIAASIILPIILAVVLKLVFQPAMRVMGKLHLPPHISALIIIALLFSGFFGLGSMLSTPATEWAQELPNGLTKVQHQFHTLMAPIKATQNVVQNAEGMAMSSNTKPVTVTIQGSSLSDRLLSNTQNLVRGIGETFLVLYFLMASGDIFLRRFIEVLPSFHDKRQAVIISQQIGSDISAYLATITFMNSLVGFATYGVMAICGMNDPALWGVLAFFLNYVPILGPVVGACLFVLVGTVSQGSLDSAILPAGLYLGVHVTESTFITPLLLAKRFTLNPVLIILGIIFWYWMWGVPGAILATPILAVAKIVCDRIGSMAAIGHFMEG
jgi:predicted PurR-regulated permease PerM